ncbi:hypothetical protein [Lentilactobacillus hilgardii]|uniref:hypothetical protein n=1 Tax=Lentilactobacillus hilgardii TaxID=1588 RepID=UPI0021A72B12|nr:hypothetical protein [Lentilactobacillus hilgardii]MCT3396268.1 hypothetical protein [Lentilactobacillus hilgardii]
MDSVFGLLDRKQTIKNAKQFLYEYRDWQLEAARFSFSLQSPMMDGMPKAQSDPRHTRQEDKMIKQATAKMECELRLKTIQLMSSIDDQNAFLADLLEYRFINHYTVKKCCERLAEKYDLNYLAERTYNDYQKQALWVFAIVCPRDTLRAKKVRR